MLDINLKNNRIKLVVTALVISLTASVVFMAFYPYFYRRAEEINSVSIEEEEFLRKLYGFNYVLYKDTKDAGNGKAADYSDIYLEIKDSTEQISQNVIPYEENYAYSYEYMMDTVMNMKNNINGMLQQYGTEFSYYSQHIDYCVIDKESGKKTTNTGKDMEALYQNEGGTAADDYDFYVVIDYDEQGQVSGLKAKSSNSDTVLKSLSQLARDAALIIGGYQTSERIVYTETYGNDVKSLDMELHGPRNSCFIYGISRNQEGYLLSMNTGINYSFDSVLWSVIRTGVGEVYRIILVVMAVLALILPAVLKYEPSKMRLFRLPVEAALILAFYLFLGLDYPLAGMITNTKSNYYREATWLSGLNDRLADSMVWGINCLSLLVIFCLWFGAITTMKKTRGVSWPDFFRERSLIIRWGQKIKVRCLRWYEDVLHTDFNQKGNKRIRQLVVVNGLVLTGISILWVFGLPAIVIYSVVLYMILIKSANRIREQYQSTVKAVTRIAQGDLETDITEDFGVFEAFKEELVEIQHGLKKAVREEVKSQRMKTELITNVSHDLKTPLTAIITYVDLLKDETITPEERTEYISTLERKSLRLKVLIDDLFEVSKASSENVTLNIMDVDIIDLMKQVRNELSDKITDSGLQFRWNLPEEKILLPLDSQKTYRIFENLYTNILKYAMAGTRVFVDAVKTEKGIQIELKNISCEELHVDTDYLTERFVRGDSARNTEGSGLGLAIAKSFTELQKGSLTVEVDGDLFKVILKWQC